MTPDRDVSPVPRSPQFAAPPAAPRDEEASPVTLFQEINERRARVEKPELLRHLRGL